MVSVTPLLLFETQINWTKVEKLMISPGLFIVAMVQIAAPIVSQGSAISRPEPESALRPGVLIPMSAQEVSTYTSNLFLGIYGVAILPDGSFVVTDKLDYKVKRFRSNGTLLKEVGKRGKGTAEFSSPVAIAASKRTIAVSDLQSSRVQIFDLDLQFLREFYVSGPVINLHYDVQENLWVGILSHGTNEALLQVNPEGEIQRTIYLKNLKKRDAFENLFNFVVRQDNRIFALFTCQNVLELWNTSGALEAELSVPGFPLKPRWIKTTQTTGVLSGHSLVPEGMLFFKLCSDSQGRIYVVGEEYAREPQKDVFVLDKKGQLIGIFQLPRKSSWISMDSQDYLWSIEDHRTRLTKYKIIPQKINPLRKQR